MLAEEVVSILLNRNENVFILPLAAVKAGLAYEPLDPSYPVERLSFMMKDADCGLLIAEETLLDLADRFERLEPFNSSTGEAMVKELSQGQGMGPWVHPIRVAVSGRGEGIGLFEMCELLGKEKTVSRLRRAANMT